MVEGNREGGEEGDDDDDDLMPTREGQQPVRRVRCYLPHLQRIQDRHFYEETGSHSFVIEVPLDELIEWDADKGKGLAEKVLKNALRYHHLFRSAIDTILAQLQPSRSRTNHQRQANANGEDGVRDTIDVLHEHRRAQQAARSTERQNRVDNDPNNPFAPGGQLEEDGQEGGNNNNPRNNRVGNATEDFPPILMRRYELRILPLGRRGTLPPFGNQHVSSKRSITQGVSLRTVRSRSMGHLVTIRGMIVRASDVKPSCEVATYSCDACGAEVYQVIQNTREFMPQRLCPSNQCRNNKSSDTLHLQTRGSKIVKFQQLTLQEVRTWIISPCVVSLSIDRPAHQDNSFWCSCRIKSPWGIFLAV